MSALSEVSLKDRLKKTFGIERCVQRLIASWCVAFLIVLINSSLEFTETAFAFSVSPLRFALVAAGLFISFSGLSVALTGIGTDAWLLALSLLSAAIVLIVRNHDFWFVFALICLAAIAVVYLFKDDKLDVGKIRVGAKAAKVNLVVAGLFSFAFIAAIGCLRYETYASPNFDLGIFVNICHNLKAHFLPLVSSERPEIVSHLSVHISPVLYLLLPVYAVFPYPATVQICQALIIASGIVPFWLLGKKYGASPAMLTLMSVCYAFNPGLVSATVYDFHENCFLIPFLLWTFWFFEDKKYVPGYIFVVLTWLVKEDAPLFTLFFGVFMFVSQKKRLHGAIVALISALYFGAAIFLLSRFGEGAMAMRFGNFMYKDEGLVGMARILITDPGYAAAQLFTPEKLIFLLELLLPLAFLPFAGRDVTRLILLVPFVLECMLTDYAYQFSIFFQYTFGPLACMLYLSVINTSEAAAKTKKFLWSFACVASILLFTMTGGHTLLNLVSSYVSNADEYELLDSYLDTVPDDVSVKACTFFVPRLADRDDVCELSCARETDYVIVDQRKNASPENAQAYAEALAKGYTVVNERPELICIMAKPEAASLTAER